MIAYINGYSRLLVTKKYLEPLEKRLKFDNIVLDIINRINE